MAITMTIKGGEKDFACIYDATAGLDVPISTQRDAFLDESRPRPLWHAGEGADGNELVDCTYDDARWPLVVKLGPADDWPELLRELAALRRTFRQAIAHAKREPWADEVYIKCQPDGAASVTYYTIKMVEDRSGGFLWGAQVPKVSFDRLAITCTVAGDGYGVEETLDNAHRNGHMLIESATAGLAAGLSVVGTPTVSLDTVDPLAGSQCQKLNVDNSTTEGVVTDLITAAVGSDAVGYVWIGFYTSNADPVYVQIEDGAGTKLEGKALYPGDSTGVSDKKYGTGAKTWYRVSVSGNNAAAANFRLRIARDSGSATQGFYVRLDLIYIEVGTTYAPNAWAGYPQVHNRNDPVAANPERVNRLDVWGVPGDRPAWMTLALDTDTPMALESVYLGNSLVPDDTPHVIECEGWSGGNADQADAYCSGGTYRDITATGLLYKYLDVAFNRVFHVLVRVRSTSTSNTFNLRYQAGHANAIDEDEVSFSNADRWEYHYCGVIDLRSSEKYRAIASPYIVYLAFNCTLAPGSIDFDHLYLLPAEPAQLMIGHPVASYTNGEQLWVMGRDERIVGDNSASGLSEDNMSALGTLWTLEPGIHNRLLFVFPHSNTVNGGGDNDAARIDYDSELTLSYRPRTRGFLP